MNNISSSQGKALLQSIEVRPIKPYEKTDWVNLMMKHHYLGFTRLIGKTLYYVATLDGRWVALIGWASAALHCKAREQWVGWSSQLKYQRLHLIANNQRFLILPDVKIKNLASKILSLNLKRLSKDWIDYHGHPILLAETFVDPERYLGTCYKASNWILLGKTQGFRKSAKKYIYHGHSKLMFVKPLEKNAKNHLTRALLDVRLQGSNMSIKFTKKQMEMLHDILKKLPDARAPKGIRHRYRSIIAIAICAVMSGAKSYVEIGEWAQALSQKQLKQFQVYYDRKKKLFVSPSESCIRRTVQRSDAQVIDASLTDWIYFMTHEDNKVLSIDGKVVKGAKDNQGNQLHLLSLFLQKQGVVARQIAIDSKTNEIPALKTLLGPIDIEGKTITTDALHTQKETANFIVEKKRAHYVLPVKDNQKTLKEDIQSLHLELQPVQFETFDKGHGRIEFRRIRTSTELNNYVDFPHVKQVFLIEREVEEIKQKPRDIRLTNINHADEYKKNVLEENEIILIKHSREQYELGFKNQNDEYETTTINISDEAFADGIAKIKDKSFTGTLTNKHALRECIEKTITPLGGQTHYKKVYIEYAYGITSMNTNQASPENILACNRGHWGIENREHYVRDKTFDEDRSQIRTKNGPYIMATLRNFAISTCRLLGFTNIAKATRDFAKKPALVMNAIGI